MRSVRSLCFVSCLAGVLLIPSGARADVLIFDDALQNGFQDYSYYGGTSFMATAFTHNASTYSVSFTPGATMATPYNAVSFAQPVMNYSTASYPTLHFWINGGMGSGQSLVVQVYQNTSTVVTSAPLAAYIAGGSIAAGTWREVTVPLTALMPPFSGTFDRIDIQNGNGLAQPTVYIDDVSLVAGGPPPANLMLIEEGMTVGGFVSDRFTWKDSAGQNRVAVLAHNTGQVGAGGSHGGELREFRYETPGGTRVVTAASSSAFSGFGYVVSHADDSEACIAGPDSSSLGHFYSGAIERVFEGRHHAIFRITLNYPRYCSVGGPPAAPIQIPVTIDWVFATGRDNPLWAITWDVAGSGVAADVLLDDSRAPYGELLFDGSATEGAHSFIAGVGWGDRYKFATSSATATYNSTWNWNTANTIPYVKLWTTDVDATMGTVQTQTITQQDAGGYFGTNRWNTTSMAGNACAAANEFPGSSAHLMPCSYNWPYQSINYSMGEVIGGNNNTGTRNTRLCWGANFGFLGQTSYYTHGSMFYGGPLANTTASGYPKKSYSTYVVLGRHSVSPVEAQVTQVEAAQSLTITAATGTVKTTGDAGVGDATAVTYAPAGYNHVYGALAFDADANALDANVAVNAGTLFHPLLIVGSYTGSLPTVKFNGTTQTQDVDYFPSLRAGANELWITLNRTLMGATNHIEISPGAAGCGPDVTSPAVTPPAAATVTQTICM